MVAFGSLSGYPDNVSTSIRFSPSASPLDDLRAITRVEAEIEQVRCERVKQARAAGATWEQVAEALNMSKQSAWEYFTERFRVELTHRVNKNSDLSEAAAMQLAVNETRAVRRRRIK